MAILQTRRPKSPHDPSIFFPSFHLISNVLFILSRFTNNSQHISRMYYHKWFYSLDDHLQTIGSVQAMVKRKANTEHLSRTSVSVPFSFHLSPSPPVVLPLRQWRCHCPYRREEKRSPLTPASTCPTFAISSFNIVAGTFLRPTRISSVCRFLCTGHEGTNITVVCWLKLMNVVTWYANLLLLICSFSDKYRKFIFNSHLFHA